MSKSIYCARCGMELKTIKKAIPLEKKVITIIEPHKCDEDAVEEFKGFKTSPPISVKPVKNVKELDEDFKDFPFVQKLNKASSDQESVSDITKDKRNKKHLREELITSTAPPGILGAAKGR